VAILRYFKGHLGVVALTVVLLVGQVVCDLAIPTYTSDIVDVGIQQGGVADAVPERMAASTLDELAMSVDASGAALLRASYAPDPDDASVVVLDVAAASGEARAELDRVLEAPEAALYDQRAAADTDASSADGDDLAAQRAAAFVLDEYRSLGLDTGAIQMRYLLVTGAKMLGLALLGLLIAVAVEALAARTSAHIAQDLRRRVFANVLTFSRGQMQEFSPASLITRCTNDVQLIQMTCGMLMRMVAMAPIMGVAAGVMVALTAPSMAWIVGVAVAAIMCVVAVLVKTTLPKFRLVQKLVDRVNLVAREMLTGMPVVRAFCREEHELGRFDEASAELRDTQLFTGRAMSIMMPGMMLVMNLTAVAVMWFGAGEALAGRVQVGDLIAFINYAMQVCMSFMMITMVSMMLPRALVAAGRVNEVVEARDPVRDPERPAPEPQGGWRGEVAFHNVCLRFRDAEADVLHDVSFTVRPGTTTAVVGSTGSGKSTLVRLVPRFYDVTAGSVTVDGVDVRDLPQAELRRLIGYVPQQAMLFSGTVRSNIAYADPGMPFERVKQAADVAQATGFVEQLPGGFDAPIAQGGTNVSGGQRQRLSIARAVAARPKVYVFDDSFSALDNETDALVRQGLARAASDAAVIVVAQRVSSVLAAEQIVVLDEGRVAGVGTHLELMEGCPAYREIAQSQLSQAELASVAAAMKGGDAR
jgi:ATP-binding cassette subfamily B protein